MATMDALWSGVREFLPRGILMPMCNENSGQKSVGKPNEKHRKYYQQIKPQFIYALYNAPLLTRTG